MVVEDIMDTFKWNKKKYDSEKDGILVFFSLFPFYLGDDFYFLQQNLGGLFWSSQNAIQSLVTIGPPEERFMACR